LAKVWQINPGFAKGHVHIQSLGMGRRNSENLWGKSVAIPLPNIGEKLDQITAGNHLVTCSSE
jgi:hypothetical protein